MVCLWELIIMYLCCSTLVCDRETVSGLPEILKKIRELGFRSFDLAAIEGWRNVNPSFLVRDGGKWAGEFSMLVATLGLTTSSINCGFSAPLNNPDPAAFDLCRREFLAVLELAKALRCPNLTVQPGNPLSGHTPAALFDALRDHLLELSALAPGVTIGVEAHQGSFLENPADTLRLARAVWPHTGITYDPSHFVMQDIPFAVTEPLLDFAVHVHVRDAALGQMQAAMGKGVVDIAGLISALKIRGYRGAVSIEHFSGFDLDLQSTCALRDLLLGLGIEIASPPADPAAGLTGNDVQ